MKSLIHKMNVKKRSFLSETIFLSHIDFMILDTIFRIFLRSLNDADIRRETTKNMRSFDKSLKSFYLLIEEVRITKVELKKFKKKEERVREFQLYKNYANDLLNKSKLITLLFEYVMFNNTNWESSVFFSINHENINYVFSSNNRSSYASKRRFQLRSEVNNYRRSIEKYNKSFINRQIFNQFIFKSLSDRKISSNSYINDEKIWSSANDSLCVKCDEIEFRSNENHQCLLLSTWKRLYLRSIVFENSTQTFFVFYNYEQYDENLKLYDHHIHKMIMFRFKSVEIFSENFRVFISESIVSFFDYSASSYELKFVSLDFFSNFLKNVCVESFYEKDSFKRSHVKDSSQFTQNTLQEDERMSQFSSSKERITKKDKKKAEKKVEMTSLVNMFNETLKSYDKIISIKDVLRKIKIDITWMNFLAWSSVICRELKRVCIKIAKKRFSKSKSIQQQQISSSSNLSNFQWMSIQIVRSQQSQKYFTVEVSQMSVFSSVVQQFIFLQSFQSQSFQNQDQQI